MDHKTRHCARQHSISSRDQQAGVNFSHYLRDNRDSGVGVVSVLRDKGRRREQWLSVCVRIKPNRLVVVRLDGEVDLLVSVLNVSSDD